MRQSGPRSYAVRLDLGPVTSPDVRRAIGERAGAYDPRLSGEGPDLQLMLTIPAEDLWMAVLLAMAAATDAGLEVAGLESHRLEGRLS